MALSPKKFAGYLFVLSSGLYGGFTFYFNNIHPVKGIPLYYIIPFLYVFTVLAYVIMVQTKNKNPRFFVYSFMMISLGRLMVYGGFVFVYALGHKAIAKPFAVTFLILYFIYTFLEIRAVYGYFKS
jgi:hypothetical protein